MSTSADTRGDHEAEDEAAVMLSEPIVAACKAYFVDLPLALTAEGLRFASHRFGEQARLLSALTSCKRPSEAMSAQLEFLRAAAHDYGKEARNIAHRARQVLP